MSGRSSAAIGSTPCQQRLVFDEEFDSDSPSLLGRDGGQLRVTAFHLRHSVIEGPLG